MKYAATVLISCFVMLTIQRNNVWRSEQSLWQDAVQKSPESPRAHVNLGREYHRSGNYQKAFFEYQTTARLASEQMKGPRGFMYRDIIAIAQSNLGSLLVTTGDTKNGETAYQATLALIPHFPPAVVGLSRLWNQQGRYAESITLLDDLIVSNAYGSGSTQRGEVFFNKGVALCGEGFQDAANQNFQQAGIEDADYGGRRCQ